MDALRSGKHVALVSDAGTPLISDPGYRLVRAAHADNVRVVPIPGASAVTAALSAAGLATDRFCFEGFPPAKRAARRKWLAALAREQRTIVFYESVHRIADCLADMTEAFGADREAFMGRELTKLHEQCVQASLGELRRRIDSGEIPLKGEFVLAVAGALAEDAPAIDVDRLLMLLVESLSPKDAARIAAELSGQKKNALYERIIELKRDS
jgi:16S rRNA (cytidine1402-2'-O)-methyltransferase